MPKRQQVRKIIFEEPAPVELYLPEDRGPFPLICLTPLLGRFLFLEDLFFERRFARSFASRGFAAALIDRPIFEFNPARGLEQIEEYLEESVARSERALSFLLTQKEIDSRRIGTFGTSFGAVIHSLWAARDPRLKAHVFSLAGGNLPEIFVTSRDPLMRNYLKAIKKSVGEGGLKKALAGVLHFDPLEAARSIPGGSVLLFLALFDRVIPLRYGLELREALGKPETLFLPLGHYTTILAIPLLRWRAIEFFRRKLS